MVIGPQEIAHRTITEKLRTQILEGKLAPGEKLPSTVEFAAIWNTSKSTAHTALNNLVKEGLLERHHGSCTYVREQSLALERIGIYYSTPRVWTDEERAYYRSLQGILEEKLSKMGIGVSVYVDRRPERKQRQPLGEIRKAIFDREIQGLILLLPNGVNLPALCKLPLPISVLTGAIGLPNRVEFHEKKYFREVMARLAAKGCKSVGLISSVTFDPDLPAPSTNPSFANDFLVEAASHGLHTREPWTIMPKVYVTNMLRYGYKEFHNLWNQSEHPDAVVVYPDMVVRGVITAALELNAHRSKDVTFCFHKNAHVEMLCPFPALWVISDEAKVADALIEQIRLQHEGKKVSPARISFDFKMTQRT